MTRSGVGVGVFRDNVEGLGGGWELSSGAGGGAGAGSGGYHNYQGRYSGEGGGGSARVSSHLSHFSSFLYPSPPHPPINFCNIS